MSITKSVLGMRVIVATIFLAIALGSFAYGGIPLAIFLSILLYIGIDELIEMMKLKGLNPPKLFIKAVSFFILGIAAVKAYSLFAVTISLAVIIAFIIILFRGKSATLNDVGATILAFMYGGWLPAHLILLRDLNNSGFSLLGKHIPDGLGYILIAFLVISLSDIAAFYVGINFGKNKLCPEISPNKTIEGSLGGTIGGVLSAVGIGYLIGLPIIHSLIAGLILSIAAQLGDLCESMIKRDAGVKDSGNLLPGHGGILDRADSYVFTGAVAYYYFNFFVTGNFNFHLF